MYYQILRRTLKILLKKSHKKHGNEIKEFEWVHKS